MCTSRLVWAGSEAPPPTTATAGLGKSTIWPRCWASPASASDAVSWCGCHSKGLGPALAESSRPRSGRCAPAPFPLPLGPCSHCRCGGMAAPPLDITGTITCPKARPCFPYLDRYQSSITAPWLAPLPPACGSSAAVLTGIAGACPADAGAFGSLARARPGDADDGQREVARRPGR